MPGTVLRNERRPVHARMLIGGEWTNSSQRIDVFNPARPDELVGTIPRGAPDDVERAIRAVKAAQPIWASKSYGERAQILAPLLERLAGDIDERAILFVRENGKTTPEARGELAGVPARQRLTLELAAELDIFPMGSSYRLCPGMRPSVSHFFRSFRPCLPETPSY
jgi:acyl-CoA reductase-like NAD-dependent aldehyde dehydrogenase